MTEAKKIISFDPGFDRLGWAVGIAHRQQYQLIACGCIETNKKSELISRFSEIVHEIKLLIDNYQPQQAALETLFFSRNTTTGLQVSEVRGIIICLLLEAKITISQYRPQEIKLAVTGYGHADKKAMQKMVMLQTKLAEQKILDDTIDAVATGITHAIVNTSKVY
jgi:crossover junction endodeoxyribonuclease RuvC